MLKLMESPEAQTLLSYGVVRNDVRRLLSKIKKKNDCWLWTAQKNHSGYGRVSYLGKQWAAHRLFYFLFNNHIDPALYVCHKCDNPNCVNPAHLFLGTAKENMKDCFEKGRHTNIFKPGDKPHNAKIDLKIAEKIILTFMDHPDTKPKVLADKYNVPLHTVKDIRRRKAYWNLVQFFDYIP